MGDNGFILLCLQSLSPQMQFYIFLRHIENMDQLSQRSPSIQQSK